MQGQGVLTRLWNPKLRAAKKHAKARLKETKRLLRIGGDQIKDDVQARIESAADALRDSLGSQDHGPIVKAHRKLDSLLEKHLGSLRKPAWREMVESVGAAVLVALILRSFVVEAFRIPSGSMIPTLSIGDQIFVNKFIYGPRIPFTTVRIFEWQQPKRGDVVVFMAPVDPPQEYIKRIVGVPGDTIEVIRGVLHINGEPVRREFEGNDTFWDRSEVDGRWHTFNALEYAETIDGKTFSVLQRPDFERLAHGNFAKKTIPEGMVFAMGDNRDQSSDSRVWGFFPKENILGRSLFVWWSWGHKGLDFDRLGTWIE